MSFRPGNTLEWSVFCQFLEGEKQLALEKLASDLEPAETERLRGMIAFTKKLLTLNNIPPTITGPDITA